MHFPAEALDLVGGHAAEAVVEGFAGFELLAVDQERVRSGERIAVFVEISEELVPSTHGGLGAIRVFLHEAGDEIINQLGDGGVLTDDDEAWRNGDAALLPKVEGLGVVTVKRLDGGLEQDGQLQGIEVTGLVPSGFRQADFLLFQGLPEISEHGHFIARNVFRHGDTRQLDDAALDGVHQGEVAHGPREQGSFYVAGATEEKRRG